MKKIVITIFISISTLLLFAQNPSDVLRLSQSMNSGTARYVSMGGAFGALGADFTSLSNNPAGLGVYRSSEFTITPSLKSRIDDTKYINTLYSDSRARFLFDNIGLVTSFRQNKEDEQGLVMVNFGIGYNRINDFYSETTAIGGNSEYSIMDYFAALASNKPEKGYSFHDILKDDTMDPYRGTQNLWPAILAWKTFLIETYDDSLSFERPLREGDGVYQDQSISSEGGIGEYVFSLAANISNKFYIGATLGLQNVYFNQTIYYSESANEANAPLSSGDLFESMNYNQSLTIEGSGINFKVGAIYRPIPELRVGFAAHTPTFYNLDERYSANMESEFNVGLASEATPINLYDYKIESPYKLIASAAYTFGKVGLISVDYEHIDYTTMRFGKGGDGYRFVKENTDIKSIFTNTFNIKTGGEIWFKQLALRGGYAYYGSPYKDDQNLSSTAINVFSGGFGLRMDSFYIDWAYQHYVFSDTYLPYLTSPSAVERDVSQNKFLLTVGFKF